MIFITYNGAPLALFLLRPDWDKPVKLTIAQGFTEVTPARSRKEQRENFGRSSRYTLEYAVLTGDARESHDLREWLKRLDDELVAVPLWTDGVEIAAAINAGDTNLPTAYGPPVQSGAEWIILSPDSSIYEIVVVSGVTADHVTISGAGATLNWPAGTVLYPLLFGYVSGAPEFKAESDEVVEGTIKIQENSIYARRLNPFPGEIPVVGAAVPGFATMPLFDIQPDASEQLEHIELERIYLTLGFGREEQIYSAEQYSRRGLTMQMLQGGRDAIAKLVRIFCDRLGTTRSFMIPDFLGNLRLTQSVPVAGDTTKLPIEASRYTDLDYAAHPGHGYIALVDPNSVDPQHVATIDGAGVHLSAAIATAHDVNSTKVCYLLLARFADSKLELTYDTDGLATARAKVIELPDEYAAPQPDPAERAIMFRFTEFVDTNLNRGLFTSYEKALTYLGATWQPAPIEGKKLSGDTKLGDKLDIATWDFPAIAGVMPANPIRRMLDGKLEGRLWCDVDEVNALAPDDGSAVYLIGGEITNLDATGKDWKAVIDPFSRFLDRPFPGFYRQKVCNVPVFSPKCAFGRPTMKDDFKSLGTIVSKTANTIDLAPVAGQPDPTAKPDDYFASGGWVEGGTAETFERRAIRHSTVVAGNLRLTIDREIALSDVGAQLRFWPGCNGAVETCIGTFNNLPNHRGHPYIPVKNPSANIGEVQQSTGGKKG
jgi:hypothetical protein